MKLILTRHGETVENVKMIFQGQSHGKLTDKGIEQAKKLALRFKDDKIDAIYSSDLQRAIDTAKEILKYHPNLKLNLDKRLRERDLGALTGKPIKSLVIDWNTAPEDVEKDPEMLFRAKAFLDEVYSKHKNELIMVICHGAIKTAILGILSGKNEFDNDLFDKLSNASVSIIDIEEDNKHKVHVIGCTKHLEK